MSMEYRPQLTDDVDQPEHDAQNVVPKYQLAPLLLPPGDSIIHR